MNSVILVVFIISLLVLYCLDGRDRVGVSRATWIVVLWAIIYGSRSVTEWFGQSGDGGVLPESVDEGSITEASINLSLLFLGLIVLLRRRIRWKAVLSENGVLVGFYAFWALSIFWSDYPIITFKRLFKDMGTLVMALVVLTDLDPGEAIKAICTRISLLCIPLSEILIRYFPEWGRAYGGYDKSEVMWVGVATHKNTLGVLAMVGAVFLLWEFLDSSQKNKPSGSRILFVSRIVVLAMSWHLLWISNSVTSIICAAIGSALLLFFQVPWIHQRPWRIEILGVGIGGAILILDSLFDLKESFLQSVGRDPTLTTRTEIWPMLMQLQPNAMLGAGFNTFWAGERLRISYEKFGGIFQAHNGYLETYLNGGWIGIILLMSVLVAAYLRVRKRYMSGRSESNIRFAVLVIAIVYNYSEASFNKIGILWLLTVFVVMEYMPQPLTPPIALRAGYR